MTNSNAVATKGFAVDLPTYTADGLAWVEALAEANAEILDAEENMALFTAEAMRLEDLGDMEAADTYSFAVESCRVRAAEGRKTYQALVLREPAAMFAA